MGAYTRKKDVKAVCTSEEAREYFKSKGLSYDDVTEGDILTLVMLLNQEIKKSNNTVPAFERPEFGAISQNKFGK